MAVYAELRDSELIGLKLHNVHRDSIAVEERYYRGEWGVPKSEAGMRPFRNSGDQEQSFAGTAKRQWVWDRMVSIVGSKYHCARCGCDIVMKLEAMGALVPNYGFGLIRLGYAHAQTFGGRSQIRNTAVWDEDVIVISKCYFPATSKVPSIPSKALGATQTS